MVHQAAGNSNDELSEELVRWNAYSPQHVARLEKAGAFPKRVDLGPNRVGWVEDEVLDWLKLRLDRRESA